MKKVLLWAGLGLVAVALAVGGLVGYHLWYDHKAPNFTGSV